MARIFPPCPFFAFLWLVSTAAITTTHTFAFAWVSQLPNHTGDRSMVLSTTRRTTPLGAKAIGPQGDYRGVRSPTGTSARVLPTQDSKTSNKPAIETVVARLWAAGLEETIPWHAGSRRYLEAMKNRRS